jgi:hypothetical protein
MSSPAFPSPQLFDLLPLLHALLLRLQPPPPPPPPGAATSTSRLPSSSTSRSPRPLDVKDLPTAAAPLKIRLQKARAVIAALPDIQRDVADQEREIAALDARIARLRRVLVALAEPTAANVHAPWGDQTGDQTGDRMCDAES